jgi:hypothetical protein
MLTLLDTASGTRLRKAFHPDKRITLNESAEAAFHLDLYRKVHAAQVAQTVGILGAHQTFSTR